MSTIKIQVGDQAAEFDLKDALASEADHDDNFDADEVEFCTGDVVMLKSGGAKMTVEGVFVDDPEQIVCVWMTEDGVLANEPFWPELLQLA